jgi:putative tributyrin esterase
MAFFDCHFFSDTLALSVSAYVLLPQQTSRQIGMSGGKAATKYQTLYLLHGLSDDHTIWMRRTSIERYAANRNLAVVMPAVDRSFYQDMARGPRYWSFLSEELPTICRQFFPLSSEREDNFAAGLSMGGYGALRLGLGKPDQFAAVASLSGALDLAQRIRASTEPSGALGPEECLGIFGSDSKIEGRENDLFALAQTALAKAALRPKVYLACGTEDDLLAENRRFHRHLDSLHFEHRYIEEPGGHEWGYWDAQIQHVLDWLPLRK